MWKSSYVSYSTKIQFIEKGNNFINEYNKFEVMIYVADFSFCDSLANVFIQRIIIAVDVRLILYMIMICQ